MICTKIDDYINSKILGETIWIVKLTNNLEVYQDDNRPGLEPSAWLRLKEYCETNNVKIANFTLRFRSHYENIVPNKTGYIFCKGCIALLGNESSYNLYKVGYIENNSIIMEKWRVPELVLYNTEICNIGDYKQLII
jgi:hypothetical protein